MRKGSDDSTAARSPPCQVLRDEHGVILRVLRVLEKLLERVEIGREFPFDAFAKCVEFFELFADACHHAKEEGVLFPALEGRGMTRLGGPLGVMLFEHRLARDFVRRMAESLAEYRANVEQAREHFLRAARGYLEVLVPHIHKEDQCLFAMADRLLAGEAGLEVRAGFEAAACHRYDGRNALELRQLAAEIEAEGAKGLAANRR